MTKFNTFSLRNSWVFPILAATLLRFYQLDQVPAGMTWDEAAIGYNGFGIVTVHRDEWLHRMPLVFRSFGDYKPPLAIYLNGIFTSLFGLKIWAIRLPFALAGIGVIMGVMVLTKLIIIKEFPQSLSSSNQKLLIFLMGMLAVVSPWLHHFSRAGFESGLALCLIIWAMVFIWTADEIKLNSQKLVISGVGIFLLAMAMYTYHSAKLVVPLLIIGILIYFADVVKKNRQRLIILGLIFAGLLLPLAFVTWFGEGSRRFGQVSVFTAMSLGPAIQTTVTNFFHHLSPTFLFLGETTSLRHGDGRWGILTVVEGYLLIIGLWQTFTSSSDKRLGRLGIYLVMIGLLPAAIGRTDEIPHANRALLAYPGFLLFFIIGMKKILDWYQTPNLSHQQMTKWLRQMGLGMTMLLMTVTAVAYFHSYFTRYANESASAFSYGYQQMMTYVMAHEDEVEKILITNTYGQPYIYVLLNKRLSPIAYNQGALIKYEFKDRIEIGDLDRPNALIVATPQEIDPSRADKLVIAPNGEVRFVMVLTNN